jgi:hypothetical protein
MALFSSSGGETISVRKLLRLSNYGNLASLVNYLITVVARCRPLMQHPCDDVQSHQH